MMMKSTLSIIAERLLLFAASIHANELKVDLNPPDARKDILTPHWENWAWHEGASGSQTFGDVTVTFRSSSSNSVMARYCSRVCWTPARPWRPMGLSPPGWRGFDMAVSGLTPGRHSIATYHNEVRDHVAPANFDVLVGDDLQIKGFKPTQRATNDYEVASACSWK